MHSGYEWPSGLPAHLCACGSVCTTKACGSICVCAQSCLHVTPYAHIVAWQWCTRSPVRGVCVWVCAQKCAWPQGECSPVPAICLPLSMWGMHKYVHSGSARARPCPQKSMRRHRVHVLSRAWGVQACVICDCLCICLCGRYTRMCGCDPYACSGPAHVGGAYSGALQWCMCSPVPMHVSMRGEHPFVDVGSRVSPCMCEPVHTYVREHTHTGCARRASVGGQRTRACTCSPVPARVPHTDARGGARVPAVPACSGPCVGRPRRAAAPAVPSRPGLAAGAGPGPLAEARPGGAGGPADGGPEKERPCTSGGGGGSGRARCVRGWGALRLLRPGRAAGCSAGIRHPAALRLEEAMHPAGGGVGGAGRSAALTPSLSPQRLLLRRETAPRLPVAAGKGEGAVEPAR